MVKVWYQPPPYGPRTDLNRPAYGIGKDVGPRWVVAISKMPATPVILGFISVFACIAYIPVMGQKLPFTLSPEYIAAQRAYMRYHNMNPIFGASSKESRDAGS